MEMLNERLAKLNIKPNNRVIRKLMDAYESRNKEELYTKVGAGIVSLDNLEKVIKTNSNFKILKFWTLFIKDDDKDDEEIDIHDNKHYKNAEHQELVVAECCHPLPGDSVVGFKDPITHQIIVHKATCDELNRLASQHGDCIVKEEIKWEQHKTQSSLATIEIVGIDRMGLLVDLANVVTNDFSINMRQVNIQSHDGIYEGTLSLYVRDADSLNALLDRLRRIKGMDSVKRVSNPS
jgi:GTP pyrophosphokinase